MSESSVDLDDPKCTRSSRSSPAASPPAASGFGVGWRWSASDVVSQPIAQSPERSAHAVDPSRCILLVRLSRERVPYDLRRVETPAPMQRNLRHKVNLTVFGQLELPEVELDNDVRRGRNRAIF